MTSGLLGAEDLEVVEARDRRERALGGAQDLAHGVVGRSARELVAAALAAQAPDEAVAHERLEDALEVLLGDGLARRDVAQGQVALALVLGEVNHHAQGVAALRRHQHGSP